MKQTLSILGLLCVLAIAALLTAIGSDLGKHAHKSEQCVAVKDRVTVCDRRAVEKLSKQ